MQWELGLLLLIILATLLVMVGLVYLAKKLLLDPRERERFDHPTQETPR